MFLLGKNKDKEDEEDNEEEETADKKHIKRKKRGMTQFKKNLTNTLNFDFSFNPSQRRKIDEYDDIKIYISKPLNYLISTEENNDNLQVIEEINFGIINSKNIEPTQRTSCNVWLKILDDNLLSLTNKRLNLAYFENQNYNVKIRNFREYCIFYIYIDLFKFE